MAKILKAYVFPPSPYSKAVLFFLEHEKLDYERKLINLRAKDQLSREYLEVNPAGRAPAIRHGDFSVGESSSILRYLASEFELDQYYPKDLESRTAVDSWLDYINQHVTPFVRELVWQRNLFPKVGREVSSDLEKRAADQILRSLSYMNERLKGQKYLCDFGLSLADFSLVPSIAWHSAANVDLGDWERIQLWLEQMTSLPAWESVEKILRDFNPNG